MVLFCLLDPEPTEEVFANEEPVPLDTTPVPAGGLTLEDMEDTAVSPTLSSNEARKQPREVSPEPSMMMTMTRRTRPSPADEELDREMSPELQERFLDPDPAPAEEELHNLNANIVQDPAAPAEELLTPEKEIPHANISITPPLTPSPYVPRQVPRMADLTLTSPHLRPLLPLSKCAFTEIGRMVSAPTHLLM